MAWILLNFVSRFGTPEILHTDIGREFISLAYDRKYDGVRLLKLPNEEVQQIIKKNLGITSWDKDGSWKGKAFRKSRVHREPK